MMFPDAIQIRGARVHNLRDVSVDIPLGKLTVISGVSGSGKSSLAHDTLFSEGQRRYLESVSVHTQRLLQTVARADVDEVTGLPPTVSVDQRVSHAPLRSTLAMTTEIHDYLRLLYARAGAVHCTGCQRVVRQQTLDEIVARILALPDRSRFMLLAPLVSHRKGAHRDVLDRIARNGLVRARVDGVLRDVADVTDLAPEKTHSIDAIVDRLILKKGVESRIRESVALAVRESGDACIVTIQTDDHWHDHYFNTQHSCPECGLSFPALDPGLFSYNNARAACLTCAGLGMRGVVDDSDDTTVFRQQPCPDCNGSRLQPFPSGVTFDDLTLAELTSLNVDAAGDRVDTWLSQHSETGNLDPAAARILPDVRKRLISLRRVGLGYLTLNRPTRTLSGGEYQRARLAACLGNQMHGACYVLDEPTNGLHPRDTDQLLTLLHELRDSGATVVVVEHDPDVMRASDHLIDIGPGAGTAGGHLLFSGTPQDAAQVDSATGRSLSHTDSPVARAKTIRPDAGHIVVRRAAQHNLRGIDVSIPLNRLVCITGVSGSGKSSLVMHTLLPVAEAALRENSNDALVAAACADARCEAIDGLDLVDRVIAVDARPVSRNRRSCIATHSGIWNDIRKLFAHTRAARARGLRPGVFSFNSGAGRCPECRGTGILELRMSMLPDAEIPCPTCGGRRFTAEILSVRFAGRSVHDVLELSVDEALAAFSELDAIHARLQPFHDVGLGYLTLGQPASTYSGGEAQRVHLAIELGRSVNDKTLYVFDEPTRGLHTADVDRLLTLLRGFVDRSDSVVIIEHNLRVMRSSDWIIDIGPEAAERGGRVVAEGPLPVVAQSPISITARVLTSDD